MNTVLAFVCLLAFHLAWSVSDSDWESYKAKYGKNYSDPKLDAMRRDIYAETLEKIKAHNALYDQGQTSYYLEENRLADMLVEEINKKLKGFRMNSTSGGSVHRTSTSGRPDSIDWRNQNIVTEVKDQGHCNSCWSFGATEAIEGQYALKNKQLEDLSEQQLVDCFYPGYTCGQGGNFFDAFNYIQQNGQEAYSTYPYTAQVGSCEFNSGEVVAKITGYSVVLSGDEDALQDAIANIGPIAVAIDADHAEFSQYSGGVFQLPSCSSTNLDHAVLAVGYGTTADGEQYYIIKNSWGADWGLQGYALISRNNNNMCGIASHAGYPTME